MIAGVLTWPSHGALLDRLLPGLEHTLLARADGSMLWESDRAAAAALQPTLAILMRSATHRPSQIDGLADPHCAPGRCFGFRVRGMLGEILGFVVIRLGAGAPELAEVHARIRPALDCLQAELGTHAAFGELRAQLAEGSRHLELYRRLSGPELGDGPEALERIPALALEHLPGLIAALVLPQRQISICRGAAGVDRSLLDADALSQLHRHLLTRVQLQACTLVANRVAFDEAHAAIPYQAISTPIHDELGRVAGVLAVFRAAVDAAFQLHDAEALEMLARKAGAIARASFDPRTGLLTEAAFLAQARAMLARATGRAPAHGILYADVDQLNAVNETHGMAVGDEIIGEVAAMLAANSRGMPAARIGGDRFAMMVPGCGIEPAARIAEELRAAAVRLSRPLGDQPVLVSLSVGVAKVGDGEDALRGALAAAEAACRNAKQRGRNRVEVHAGGSPAHAAPAGAASSAPAPWVEDSFELYAQPVLPLGGMTADPRFEVLLRVRAADGARLTYEKWAQGGADRALVRRLDRWALETVLAKLSERRDALREHPASLWLNLSAASLADAGFWRSIGDLLRDARLPAGVLGFEFAESALDGQIGRIAPAMSQLRERGVNFALDNFGRDGGSLASLRALPFTAVKIDGRFCRDVVRDPRARSTVLAVAQLAHAFGLDAIATHVESDAVRARVAELGADFGQGFLIGRPAALDEVLRDLPLYSCFSTSTGLFDIPPNPAAARAG